jgi:hypothetical protein
MQIIGLYRKVSALFIFALLTLAGHSQTTINSYKYVLVPQKFDFLRDYDQYGLNTTTRSLLEAKGFVVFWTNGDLPQTLAANRCTALMVEVTQRKAMFTTNLTILLKDCTGNVIFKSKEGRSWEKEYPVAYDQAIKDAFSSFKNVPYKYDSSLVVQPQPLTAAPATTTTTAGALAPPAATATAPAAAPQAPVSAKATVTDTTRTLYAQAIPNGYQLIDTSPKKVLTLLKTSVPDCFLADPGNGASNGIVFKRNAQWFFDYYKEGALVSQPLEIKF